MRAAGRSCEEGNQTLEVPDRLATKLPAGETPWEDAHGRTGDTVWKTVLWNLIMPVAGELPAHPPAGTEAIL